MKTNKSLEQIVSHIIALLYQALVRFHSLSLLKWVYLLIACKKSTQRPKSSLLVRCT